LTGKCPVAKQHVWIEQFYEKFQNLDLFMEVVLFMESIHPIHNTVYAKVWSEIGIPRWICSSALRNRLNISEAYNPINQELVIVEDATVNEKSTINLFGKRLGKYPEKEVITFCMENVSYHKEKVVKKFIQGHPKINLSFFPPYSPNLNLIERLWKFIKEKVINLKYYHDFNRFKEQMTDFYNNIQKYADELEIRITFNFQNVIS